jgi:hypothetical protein
MNRREARDPIGLNKKQILDKKNGEKEFKPSSKSSEQGGLPSKWPSPRQSLTE